MDKELTTTLISTLGGGILSGLLLLLLTHMLSRRKMDAEIRQIEVNTQKTALEMTQMRSEPFDVRTRTIDRLKLGNHRCVILREEERTIRG